jgi:hypothetical protein
VWYSNFPKQNSQKKRLIKNKLTIRIDAEKAIIEKIYHIKKRTLLSDLLDISIPITQTKEDVIINKAIMEEKMDDITES